MKTMQFLLGHRTKSIADVHFIIYSRGVKLILTGGHISLVVAFKGPKVTLGLYKCNYSLTVKQELGAAA